MLDDVNPRRALALLLDPSLILTAQGLTPDPWQRDLLLSQQPYLLLNCARQTGKSTTVAALALHRLLLEPGSLVRLVAPAERQSHEFFRKVIHAYHALDQGDTADPRCAGGCWWPGKGARGRTSFARV